MGRVERSVAPAGASADAEAASERELPLTAVRDWLRVPSHLGLPAWARPRLSQTLRDERDARVGRALEETVFGVVDLETTGTSTDARILEVGLVVLRGALVLEKFETLVDVGAEVPSGITSLTGISTDLLVGAPEEASVLARFAQILERNRVEVLVAHNASFDRAFLERAWRDHRREPALPDFVCSVRLARRCVRAPSFGLDSLIQHLSIPLRARHRALGDAEMTADLWLELLGRCKLQGIHTLEALREVAEVGRHKKKAGKRVRVVHVRDGVD
ncbi:MAG: hypothetical protein GY725_16125 [bacterium]|nr:hypothetical protein [bacterium]